VEALTIVVTIAAYGLAAYGVGMLVWVAVSARRARQPRYRRSAD
jgi:hypothetical protein